MASTNPARGMRDFLPADVRKREYVIDIIKEVYESYGFEPLETPAVENIDTLMGKYGDEGNQLIFKILKRGQKLRESLGSLGSQESPESLESQETNASETVQTSSTSETDLSDLALRYDLTVPLARVVANHRNELPKFFKRYQIQPVWRADRPARGRFREFYQCDVDVIGSTSMVVEAQLVSAVTEILRRLGFDAFTIRINHRSILYGLLEVSQIPKALAEIALVAVDKIDKIGMDGVRNELSARGLSSEQTSSFLDYVSQFRAIYVLSGNTDEYNDRIIRTLEQIYINDPNYDLLINGTLEVADLVRLLSSDGKLSHIKIDPSLARGLSYYTGTIMEINVPDLAGSLGGGGRYDGLIGMFGKEQIPACGFSLGLERILVVMEERGMFPPEIVDSAPADVMVTIFGEDTVSDSIKLANDLRSGGLRVTLYPEPDKLGKQLKYADTINVPFVCILGPEEAASGKAKLKNMKSGVESTVSAAEIIEKIARN